MTLFVGELIGTALLVLLGNATCASVLLTRSKGENSGWMVITTGWALALFVAVFVSVAASGAHLNPVVSLTFWWLKKIQTNELGTYIAAQFVGAAIGAILVWLVYLPHWGRTDDPAKKLMCFATVPAVRAPVSNLFSEIVGTFVLVFGILAIKQVALRPGSTAAAAQAMASVTVDSGALGAIPVALLLWVIGLGLGGTTGFAVNPARDLAPRIIHAITPIPGKGTSDWSYAWIPIIGPVIGGFAAAALARAVGL